MKMHDDTGASRGTQLQTTYKHLGTRFHNVVESMKRTHSICNREIPGCILHGWLRYLDGVLSWSVTVSIRYE